MMQDSPITKVHQIIPRKDGSEVKIVVTDMSGIGLERSLNVDVFKRPDSASNWQLCSNRPHPESKSMSVDEYIKHGRSEMLQVVSHAEILKLTSMIGKPMSMAEAEQASV